MRNSLSSSNVGQAHTNAQCIITLSNFSNRVLTLVSNAFGYTSNEETPYSTTCDQSTQGVRLVYDQGIGKSGGSYEESGL